MRPHGSLAATVWRTCSSSTMRSRTNAALIVDRPIQPSSGEQAARVPEFLLLVLERFGQNEDFMRRCLPPAEDGFSRVHISAFVCFLAHVSSLCPSPL